MNLEYCATEITENHLDQGNNEKLKIMVNMVKFGWSTGGSFFNAVYKNLLGEYTGVTWIKRSDY
jgi:hypothetical protein